MKSINCTKIHLYIAIANEDLSGYDFDVVRCIADNKDANGNVHVNVVSDSNSNSDLECNGWVSVVNVEWCEEEIGIGEDILISMYGYDDSYKNMIKAFRAF